MDVILSQLLLLASPGSSTHPLTLYSQHPTHQDVGTLSLTERLSNTLQTISPTSLPIAAIINDESKGIHQKYVQTCLFFLLELRAFLVSHPQDKSSTQQRLSIQSQAIIKTVLEIVVCWGIYPLLHTGVGVPISLRSKTATFLTSNIAPSSDSANRTVAHSSTEGTNPIDNGGNRRQLLECVRSFLHLQQAEELAPIILTRNLPDIFAAIIQLLHEPVDSSQELTREDKYFCESSINQLIKSVNPSLVVEGLSMGLGKGEAWYTQAVGMYLSQALMCPHALRVVLDRVLGSDRAKGSSSVLTHVVKLVTTCPGTTSKEEYYANICPQLLLLLHTSSKTPEYIRQAAVAIVGKMRELNPECSRKYFFAPLLSPLKRVSKPVDVDEISANANLSEGIIVDEGTLSMCVEDIHTLSNGLSLSQEVMGEIASIIPVLFRMHLFTSRTKSYLKTAVQEILVSFFRFSTKAVALLKDLILPKDGNETADRVVSFSPGSGGGVVARIVDSPQRNFQDEAMALVTLLKEMKNDKLAGDLFVDLLAEFLSSKKLEEGHHLFSATDPFIAPRDNHSGNRYLVLLEVVAIIGEQMGASVLKNVVQVCTLLKVLLTHEDPETLSLALGLVLALLSGGIKVSVEEETLIYDLVPHLDQLLNHPESQISEMTAHLKTLILTNNAEWRESKVSEGLRTSNKLNDEIKQIMEDVRDPLLPVRAHGLISLRKLVLRKDPEVKIHATTILDIFWTQINDEDSYVFQTAINGLAALGDIYPDAKQFSNSKLREDTRLKLGEALLQVAARCGEVLPKYGNHFVHNFLIATKDSSANTRASALSLLASFCEIMRFALHPFIQEILSATNAILATDSEAIVRRGAVFVFKQLLTSMGKDLFTLVPEDMKDILIFMLI